MKIRDNIIDQLRTVDCEKAEDVTVGARRENGIYSLHVVVDGKEVFRLNWEQGNSKGYHVLHNLPSLDAGAVSRMCRPVVPLKPVHPFMQPNPVSEEDTPFSRLYAIRNQTTKELVGHATGLSEPGSDPLYFESKRGAMRIRDQLSAYTNEKHVVVFGPDHLRYKNQIEES